MSHHQTEAAIMALLERYRDRSLPVEDVYRQVWGDHPPSAGADGMIRRVGRSCRIIATRRNGHFFFITKGSQELSAETIFGRENLTIGERIEELLRQKWHSVEDLQSHLSKSHRRALYSQIAAVATRLKNTPDRLWRRQVGKYVLFWIGPQTAEVEPHPIQKMENALRQSWCTVQDLLACWPLQTSKTTMFSALGRLKLNLISTDEQLVRRGPRSRIKYRITPLPVEQVLINFLKTGKHSARECMIRLWGEEVKLGTFYAVLGKANRQIIRETEGDERINSSHDGRVRRYWVEATDPNTTATLIAMPGRVGRGFREYARQVIRTLGMEETLD
jgi:hypothetical protein